MKRELVFRTIHIDPVVPSNFRLDVAQPSTSSKKMVDEPSSFNNIGYNSFGKASVSSFSAKSGSSTSKENLEKYLDNTKLNNILKPISTQETMNMNVNSVFVPVKDLEHGTDTLNNNDTLKKKAADKSAKKLTPIFVGTPLPPGEIKCNNILKGKCRSHINYSVEDESLMQSLDRFAARAEEEGVATPTKLTNQLYVRSATANNSNTVNGGDESLNAATIVSVVSLCHPNSSVKHTSIVIRFISLQMYFRHNLC